MIMKRTLRVYVGECPRCRMPYASDSPELECDACDIAIPTHQAKLSVASDAWEETQRLYGGSVEPRIRAAVVSEICRELGYDQSTSFGHQMWIRLTSMVADIPISKVRE
jgi:hypothetical protein